MSECTDKKIAITGTGNRYLIKKVMKPEVVIKNRKEIDKWDIPIEYYTHEKQLEIIERLFLIIGQDNVDNVDNADNVDNYKIIKSQLDKKISGYKYQDIIKKKYEETKFVELKYVIEQLSLCKLTCYYCLENVALLYKIVREHKQWTLDRIDNDLGHNVDNVVIACLECNLKRRKTNKDAFVFTKQLNITKQIV